MKKYIVIIFFSGYSLIILGNTIEKDTISTRKNVILINAPGIVSNFFEVYSRSYAYSREMITYKRIIKNFGLRLMLGGDINNSEDFTNDTVFSKYNGYYIFSGLGIELYHELNHRWQLYYGIDLFYLKSYSEYFYHYSNDNSRSTKNNEYLKGIKPFYGLLFKINETLSISTEAVLEFSFSQSNRSKNDKYNNLVINEVEKTKKLDIDFSPPMRIDFLIKF